MADFNKLLVGSQEYRFVDSSLAEIVSSEIISNPEYLRVITDSEDRVLCGIKSDGTVYWAKGVPTPIKNELNVIDSSIENINDNVIEINSSLDFIKDNIEYFINVDTDTHGEFLSLVTDQSTNILEGIRYDGTKINNLPQMFNNPVEFNDDVTFTGKAKFSKDIKSAIKEDFVNISDWSKEKHVRLPKPTVCAKVNIITEKLPTKKSGMGIAGETCDIPAELEYWDKLGNYFKKPIILSAQGSSSMTYPVKNLSFDLDDKSEIKFGNWVAQDSFHLKVYYIDVFRGICNAGYNYVESVIKYTGLRSNRHHFSEADMLTGTGKPADDFREPALCHPDGFPVEVYVNGEYHDLMAWNIKKHRANYSMKKTDYNSVILDGELGNIFINNIDWDKWEIRNPKDMYCMDGTKYDGENPKEIIDSTSEFWDDNNATHLKTAQTKNVIKRLAGALNEVDACATTELKREKFAEFFDVDAIILYYILSNVVYHYDGFWKNWIWTIYDNKLAAPNFYDMDSIFGRNYQGTCVDADSVTTPLGAGGPAGKAYQLYRNETKSMYKTLRDKKLIDVDYIISFVQGWVDSVGTDAYGRLFDKYSYDPTNGNTLSIPSYRDSLINTEYWKTEFKRNSVSGYLDYNNTTVYHIGDKVLIPNGLHASMNSMVFECIKANGPHTTAGVQNLFTGSYLTVGSAYLGMYDSVERIRKWLELRIAYLDEYFNYTV